MKTFKIQNYKGNIIESLKKFSDSHKGMKIVEAIEEDNTLKIKAENNDHYSEYVVYYKLFNEKDNVLYLSAKSSKDAIFSAIDTIKVRNHLKTRNDVFEILQSIEVKK